MNFWRSKLCALALVLAMLPGAAEVVESAIHLATEGHLAHATAQGDQHEPNGPEHGCTPISHFCGCHVNLAFLKPQHPPRLILAASLFKGALAAAAQPPGFSSSIDRPPRAWQRAL